MLLTSLLAGCTCRSADPPGPPTEPATCGERGSIGTPDPAGIPQGRWGPVKRTGATFDEALRGVVEGLMLAMYGDRCPLVCSPRGAGPECWPEVEILEPAALPTDAAGWGATGEGAWGQRTIRTDAGERVLATVTIADFPRDAEGRVALRVRMGCHPCP